MVKKPTSLKKAAREDAEAAEEVEDAGRSRREEEDEEPAGDRGDKKKRKARPAKLRRDNKKAREHELKKEEKKKRDGVEKDDDDYLDRRIFIANLPEKTTCEDLRELFEKFGSVHSARLHVNSRGQFRGVGFVTFESTDELEQALSLNGMEYKQKTLKVEKAQPPKKIEAFDVFVGGLPYTAEEKKIRKHFKACGDIKAVKMLIDWKKEKFNGTAFIRFKRAAAAEAALKLHDSMFAGRTITVKLALPKKKLKDRKDMPSEVPHVEDPKKPTKAEREAKKAKKAEVAEAAAEEPEPSATGGEAAESKREKRKVAKAKSDKRKAEELASSATAAEAKSEAAAEEPAPKKKKLLKKKKEVA